MALGLSDPTTAALNGIRWLGSGSILPLADGRYGMLFGGGNCLDSDSDAFHFIGYAETDNQVTNPSDLLSWHLVNKCDNPILSTRPFHRLAGDLLAVDLEHADAPASDAAYIVEGERANPQAILFEVEFERVLAGRQRLWPPK
jgi:hypothetical protein